MVAPQDCDIALQLQGHTSDWSERSFKDLQPGLGFRVDLPVANQLMERVPRSIHLMLHQARASLQIKVNISQLGKHYFREIGAEKISFLVFWDDSCASGCGKEPV